MKYKYEPHNPKGRVINWPYCVKCGLIYLKNEPTEKAIKLGCNWNEAKTSSNF